jgi:hypothetical protein
MEALKGTVRPEAREDVSSEELEGEILVYDPDSQKTFNFNGTGAFIWSLCDGHYALNEIIDAIDEQATGTNREMIREDVEQFVGNLCEDNLIRLHDD